MSRGVWKKECGEYPEEDSDRPFVLVSKNGVLHRSHAKNIVPSTMKIHGHARPVISTHVRHCRE